MLKLEVMAFIQAVDDIAEVVGPLSDKQKYTVLANVVSVAAANAVMREKRGLGPVPENYNAKLQATFKAMAESKAGEGSRGRKPQS